jgi:nitrogen fixation/metabolism regulation signal transduction histidine kinase
MHWLSALARRLGDSNIRTKLLLTMLSLLVLSVSSLFVLHLLGERQLLSQVREYTEELSTAIEIAQEQPAGEGDPQVVLNAYADKLRQLGVKDVSMADADEEVQASTNPENVGKRLVRASPKRKGPKQYVIRGVLGEEAPGVKTSTLTIPVIVGDRRIGYVVITRNIDDFSALSNEALVNRLIATLVVFGFGILLSLYLSWTFSRPLYQLTYAARAVASGSLDVSVPAGGKDEVGALSRTFNEMVGKLREKQLLEERLHFAERSTAIGRLASAVAHEIRNPLNFISLSMDHVREKLHPDDTARRENFDRIIGNVKGEISRLNRLVNDFLSFGRPMRLDRRVCAIGDILREVAALVDHKARDQGISLELELEELPDTLADPELLKTCFLNLMINAVDAMPSGGVLRVTGRKDRDSGGDVIVVTVADNGLGMTPEEVQAAFEPYFSTKETGVGLGLSLTRKIVGDHGGSIALESAKGQGTTARIVLPVVAEAVRAEAIAS